MKKIILLAGVLCVLASAPVRAEMFDQFPRGNDWNRNNNNHQYWERIRMDREAREHNERDNGNHYAYGKDPKHHKEGWKGRSKHKGKAYGNSRPRDPNKHYDKSGNKYRENN